MTDKESLEFAANMFDAIDKKCQRLTTANFMHDVNGIRGLALNNKVLIERHLEKNYGAIQKDIS